MEPAGAYDLLSIRPARAVAGERVVMTLRGLHASPFTRASFVAAGAGCAARLSEVTLNASAPVAMTAPSAGGKYTICYTLVGQGGGYVKQLGDGAEFWAIDPASSEVYIHLSIYIDLSIYLSVYLDIYIYVHIYIHIYILINPKPSSLNPTP